VGLEGRGKGNGIVVGKGNGKVMEKGNRKVVGMEMG
jgi:hypothetical protein